MQRSILAFSIAAALLLTSVPATAVQRGNGGGPKARPTTQAPKVKTSGAPKIQAAGPKAKVAGPKTQVARAHGPKVKSTTVTAKTAKTAKTTKTAKAPTSRNAKKSDTSRTTSVSTTATTTTTTSTSGTSTTPVALTPVQQKLQKNTNLASKLRSRLPAGTDLMTAAAGFRNLGQFVAAVNVSNNLGIPFTQLKTSMVTDGNSLGQSIQTLRPTADSQYQVQRAETDANLMIRTSEATTSKTTTTTTTTTTSTSKRPKSKVR